MSSMTGSRVDMRPGPPSMPQSMHRRPTKRQAPQKGIDDLWDAFTTKYPGKVLSILPKNAYAKSKAAREPKGITHSQDVSTSYEEAKDKCIRTVAQITKECRRVNIRYRDPHFDIEFDLKRATRNCLDGITDYNDAAAPKAVKRVPQIFDDPQFYVNGATSSDIRQGNAGDCWFLAALGALTNKDSLINRVCVAQEPRVGVYGFVFHRDGEWIYEVIDDKLYLSVADFDESRMEDVSTFNRIANRQNPEEEFRKTFQTGSQALYFAQCRTTNETWLPLLEKAYAKAHGDYYAIEGGFTGEAIEDLTGGVTTELFTSDILDDEKFWIEELTKVNDEFLFGCATGRFDGWQGGGIRDRKGIKSSHAYSIMEAKEVKGERLLKIRNPWGDTEWTGAWSDGSEQWTPEWMELLGHKFGDDGVFWISYKDFLRKYQFLDRTRLFGPEWGIALQWTTVDVPWSADYNETKFMITLTEQTPIVIVLSQLDDRYWIGLEGKYTFSLHFRVEKDGEEGYIVRSHGNYSMNRSVSTELELEPGTYSILMKITATRDPRVETLEEAVRRLISNPDKREKLLQVGLAYDLAHAKGLITLTEEEKRAKAEQEARDKKAAKKKAREEAKKSKLNEWYYQKRAYERTQRQKERKVEHKRKKQDALSAKQSTKAEEDLARDEQQGDGAAKQANGIATPGIEDGAAQEEEVRKHLDDEDGNEADTEDIAASEDEAEHGQSDPLTREKIKQFNAEVDSSDHGSRRFHPPRVQVNGQEVPGETGLPSPPQSPFLVPPPVDHGEQSDSESSVLTFVSSIDTILDLNNFDIEYEDRGGIDDIVDEDNEIDNENMEFADDPWNAVCVVGLRVYTTNGEVSVAVVRPKVGGNENDEAPLDLDDVSKGISEEGKKQAPTGA